MKPETKSKLLLAWLEMFQPELQDDIDHGARIDCTRKPGFYVRQYKTWQQVAHGDWMLVDIENDRVLTAEEYLKEVIDDDDVERIAKIIYQASNDYNGLSLDCAWPHGEHYCDCDTPGFLDIDDVIALRENQSEEFDHLYKQISVDDVEEFCKWVGETDAGYVAETLEYAWETDDSAVFLTRKSGERYQARHPCPDSRIYANWVWHNPDLYNAITLLAALDLEKSMLVFDEDRLDQLDY
jgi:hypothetical protein